MFKKQILIGSLLLYTAIFFFFYPLNTGIVDETAYLSMAYTLQNGKLYYDQAGIYAAPASIKFNNHLASRYPPGNSLLLLPFTRLNYNLIFLRGYILMVLGFIILIAILSHYNLPSYYALLFLFHPSMVLYSRTVMSDLPCTICCLAGLISFIKKKYILAGIVFGLNIAIRYPSILIPIALIVIFFIKKDFSNLVKFLIGNATGVMPILLYHILVFHTVIGPARANIIGFSFSNLPIMFFQFFLMINIIFPLMLLISFKTKLIEKWYFIFPVLIFLLFFSLQYYSDTGKNFFETLIRGQRYMLPVIPFLIIPYSEFVERTRFFKKILTGFIITLVFLNIIISYKHQRFLDKQTYYQNKLYEYAKDADVIVGNKDIYELINPFIKPVKWESFESEGKLINVNISNDNKKIYLACLARSENIKNLFYELLIKTKTTKEIYKEENPQYFAIYLME